MVELIVNGKSLELTDSGNEIKYSKRIADIFNVSAVTASYTNSFTAPKTPKNTQALQHLGLSGSNSQTPYNKVSATLKKDGIDIIKNGWLQVVETSDTYKLSIIDGMIDFFKAIDNITIGVDLDISDFNHEKNLDVVLQTWREDNPRPFTYIIADYNGENYTFVGGRYGLNIDYLVPSFSVERLLNLAFNKAGFVYDIDEIDFIKGLYITYPLPPSIPQTETQIATMSKNAFVSQDFVPYLGAETVSNMQTWSAWGASGGAEFLGNRVKLPATSAYRIAASVEAYFRYAGDVTELLEFVIAKNGTIVYSTKTSASNAIEVDYSFQAVQGDIIDIGIRVDYAGNGLFIRQIRLNSFEADIYQKTGDLVTLDNAFKDFKVKDFFKEILWRSGLTPYIEANTNKVRFVPLYKRTSTISVTDWSNRYISRSKEIYTPDGYGQKNRFALKHDNELDQTGDGFLYVNNKNLPDEVTIAESKIYAPELIDYTFVSGFSTPIFKTQKFRVWNKEPKENPEEEYPTIEYKGLSNRFYFIRPKRSQSVNIQAVTASLNGNEMYNGTVPYADINYTLFDQTTDVNYLEYSKILSNFKVQTIELALGIDDIVNVDFLKPFYFKPENAYFMLNTLTWQDGKNSTGEFVKLNQSNG